MENQATGFNGSTDQQPIKFGNTTDSDEILIFTSYCNVYKVPKSEIYNIHQVLDKIDPEEGEKPVYITGDKKYSGFLIVAFENGKIGKIAMNSFSTDYKRKKLKNAFNNDSNLVFIQLIETDIDIVAVSSIKKVILFNTSLINPVGSRTTKGVQVLKQKDGSKTVSVLTADQAKLADPEFYRKGLNVVGFYLRKGDEL